MQERWKPISAEFADYEISDLGRVRRIRNTRSREFYYPKVGPDPRYRVKRPYYYVNMYSETLKKFVGLRVHRLVALAFIPNPENKPEVNHAHGDKSDNRAIRLEWMTRSENKEHAFNVLYPLSRQGAKNNLAKLTDAAVLDIRTNCRMGCNVNRKAMAAKYQVSYDTIVSILKQGHWTHVEASTPVQKPVGLFNPNCRISDETVQFILGHYRWRTPGRGLADTAKLAGCSMSQVANIVNGRQRKIENSSLAAAA